MNKSTFYVNKTASDQQSDYLVNQLLFIEKIFFYQEYVYSEGSG